MLQEFLNLLIENAAWLIFFISLGVLGFFFKRYLRFQYLFKSCRALAERYEGRLEKTAPLVFRVFKKSKHPDVKMFFAETAVDVMFVRIKKKTALRFRDEHTMEKIRYRKAFPLGGNNRGLFPSTVVTFAGGNEIESLSKLVKLNFPCDDGGLRLLLFTENPSQMWVYDPERKNYDMIGDGETAFGYIVGGRHFLQKWMARNE